VPRQRRIHLCQNCGATSVRWAGRCSSCGEWNSFVEQAPSSGQPGGFHGSVGRAAPAAPGRNGADPGLSLFAGGSGFGGAVPLLLSSIDPDGCEPSPTGLDELDRVLAGGLTAGSVTLIGGEPGIGKSTLVLQALASASLAAGGARTLLIAAEESAEQVRRRADRLGALVDNCYVVETGELQVALEAAGRLDPDLLVVDSIQTIGDGSIGSQTGSTTQVRECAQALAHYAKATSTATVLVGHVTKDGALAGPRALEHLVDTVLSFEGDRHHALRFLVATKHRYGATGELGLFEMGETGLVSLDDPSALLLGDRLAGVPGTMAVPIVEGRRPLLVEMQALFTPSHTGAPRRVVQGYPASRLALILAVIERSLALPAGGADAFVSTVGGIRVTEPAADLGAALALVSAMTGVPVPSDVVAFGEVGLSGEIRQAPNPERRMAEAVRLGFRRAVVPKSTPQAPSGIVVLPVSCLGDAVGVLGLFDQAEGPLASAFSR